MKRKEKNKMLSLIMVVGLISAMLVLLAAYSASLRVENNSYIKSNQALRGEIDTLKVKIKSANNVEHIEKVAMENLGMVYPEEEQCIYLTSEDKPAGNFAMTLKTKAYN